MPALGNRRRTAPGRHLPVAYGNPTTDCTRILSGLLQEHFSESRVASMQLRVPPPILMLLAAVLMWAVHHWRPLWHWIVPPWNRVGGLVGAVGVAIGVAALVRFRQARTTPNPMDPHKASCLVTDGVFCGSRNPMYLGLVLMLIGWAIWLGSTTPWLIPPLFVIVITVVQIIPEEHALEQRFGDQYLTYRRSVPRWIGWYQ